MLNLIFHKDRIFSNKKQMTNMPGHVGLCMRELGEGEQHSWHQGKVEHPGQDDVQHKEGESKAHSDVQSRAQPGESEIFSQ